jgi:hypothetical protein
MLARTLVAPPGDSFYRDVLVHILGFGFGYDSGWSEVLGAA